MIVPLRIRSSKGTGVQHVYIPVDTSMLAARAYSSDLQHWLANDPTTLLMRHVVIFYRCEEFGNGLLPAGESFAFLPLGLLPENETELDVRDSVDPRKYWSRREELNLQPTHYEWISRHRES